VAHAAQRACRVTDSPAPLPGCHSTGAQPVVHRGVLPAVGPRRAAQGSSQVKVRGANRNPWERRWGGGRGAERAGAARPLHGASPPPRLRSAPHPLLCASPRPGAAAAQEMRRGGSRREPALSPRRGGGRRLHRGPSSLFPPTTHTDVRHTPATGIHATGPMGGENCQTRLTWEHLALRNSAAQTCAPFLRWISDGGVTRGRCAALPRPSARRRRRLPV
jgi:hypothetical protein